MVARVCDFNFKPLNVALDSLMKTSKQMTEESNKPTLLVQLSISKAWCRSPSIDGYPKWCKWVRDNSKGGTGITVDYQIEEVEDAAATYKLLDVLGRSQYQDPSWELFPIFLCFETWYVGDPE